MSKLARHWTSWRRLSPADRPVRVRRTVERWLRRHPRLRRRLCPDLPGHRSFARALCVDPDELSHRLVAGGASRGPLFADLDARAAAVARFQSERADALLAQAERLRAGWFDLLGSGPCRPLRLDGGLDWHADWVSSGRWPDDLYHSEQRPVRGDGSDVKLPWELSRSQHLLVLGQAYRLAPYRLPISVAADARRHLASTARDQILDWIDANPRGFGINWTCTMDVAIRSMNWIAAFALFRDAAEFGPPFALELSRALWLHGRHIRRNLEIVPGRPATNHYLADLCGLLAVGTCLPEIKESDEWRERAWTGLLEQIDVQVLEDGASFERSIPYHRLATEIFVHAALLRRGAGHALPEAFTNRLGQMLDFTASCTRPDGSAPQWGDNDDGRLLPLDGYASARPHDHRHLLALGGALLGRPELVAEAGERDLEALWLLGPEAVRRDGRPRDLPSCDFPHVGYFVLRHDDLHAAVSWGPVGTAGLGNHSHNDLGAVCFWAAGNEWITDPGSGTYTRDPALRNRLRSTAAHATLQLGDREQNPFGEGIDDLFLLRERARPSVSGWSASRESARLSGSHRGFSSSGEAWIHERTVRFEGRRRIVWILDSLTLEDDPARPARPHEPVHLRFPLSSEVSDCAWIAPDGGAWPEPVCSALEETAHAEEPSRRIAARLLAASGAALWIALELPAASRVDLVEAPYSPRYGVVLSGKVLEATIPPARVLRVLSVLFSP